VSSQKQLAVEEAAWKLVWADAALRSPCAPRQRRDETCRADFLRSEGFIRLYQRSPRAWRIRRVRATQPALRRNETHRPHSECPADGSELNQPQAQNLTISSSCGVCPEDQHRFDSPPRIVAVRFPAQSSAVGRTRDSRETSRRPSEYSPRTGGLHGRREFSRSRRPTLGGVVTDVGSHHASTSWSATHSN